MSRKSNYLCSFPPSSHILRKKSGFILSPVTSPFLEQITQFRFDEQKEDDNLLQREKLKGYS